MGLSIEDIEQWARWNNYTIVSDNWWEAAQDTINKYRQLQADYENRLKADLKAILVDLQLDVEGQKFDTHMDKDVWNDAIRVCSELIQQKINELKAESEGEE